MKNIRTAQPNVNNDNYPIDQIKDKTDLVNFI